MSDLLRDQHVSQGHEAQDGAATATADKTPEKRGVRASGNSLMARVLSDLKTDENLLYLAARLQNYSDLTGSRIESLRQAIETGDGNEIEDVAHALSDSTAKIGAIRMMKLCIAMQMLGRRGLVHKARTLMTELDGEYERFKEGLISAVG